MGSKGKRLLLCSSFVLCGYFCSLSLLRLLFLSLFSFLIFLFATWKDREEKESYQRFLCISFYMEQVLYSFERSGKILSAFEEIKPLVAEALKPHVDCVLDRIRSGLGGDDIYGYALSAMEDYYQTDILSQLHRFMVQAEELGGEIKDSIALLKAGVASFEEEKKLFYLKRNALRNKLVLSDLLGLLVCTTVMKLLPDWSGISLKPFFQNFVLFIFSCFLLLFYLFWGLSGDKKKMNLTGEKRYALVWSREKLKFKDRILRSFYEKEVYKEARLAFSDWMFDMLLRLQLQTVETAVRASIEHADPSLILPLWELLNGIKEDPVSSEPYLHFLEPCGFYEVRAVMLEIYSTGQLGKNNIGEAFKLLLLQNQAMQRETARERAEDRLSAYGMLAALPMALSVCMLIVTLSMVLLGFLSGVHLGSFVS